MVYLLKTLSPKHLKSTLIASLQWAAVCFLLNSSEAARITLHTQRSWLLTQIGAFLFLCLHGVAVDLLYRCVLLIVCNYWLCDGVPHKHLQRVGAVLFHAFVFLLDMIFLCFLPMIISKR